MTRSERIEILQRKFPDFMKINPYLETRRVDAIKEYMSECGAYKSPASQIPDTMIINLIVSAQGKPTKKFHTAVSRKNGARA